MSMPGKSFTGKLPPLTEQERDVSHRLQQHVQILAGEIGERNVWTPRALNAAAAHIRQTLVLHGYSPTDQTYRVDGVEVANIDVEIRGTTKADEIIVIGAHYDSVRGCPAANDNGSGVAAMLEMARMMQNDTPARTIRFVAFVNEEPPFFHTEQMGSLVYARRCKERGEKIVGMISVETIGCYSDEKGSQNYPFPFSLFYPSRGNFIAFVANNASRKWLNACIGTFREQTQFPSEGAAMPENVTGVGWSDQWSFWQSGYPALMVTDTAPFRYAHYHEPSDTPDKIDYDRTARVTVGLTRVVRELANAQSQSD